METNTDTKPKSKKKTNRGRPKGSTNREYADVVVCPPKCPSCSRAIDTKSGRQFRQVEYHHKAEDGTISNCIRWYRTRCSCGQWITYRRNEFDPDLPSKSKK